MRILVVQESDWIEKGPHHSHHLMERLSKRGHEVKVIDYEILWLTNAVGTKNVIRLQKKKRLGMIFFYSTEVYGDYDGVMSEDAMEKILINI